MMMNLRLDRCIRWVRVSALVIASALLGLSPIAMAQEVGKPAPAFSLMGADGKTYALNEITRGGNLVVLEWLNHGCPYVKKHYKKVNGLGNMQKLQAEFGGQGVTWLSVDSSGKYSAAELNEQMKTHDSRAKTVLMDLDGRVGKLLYKARTTPQMVIIDSKQIVRYNGAIDSVASTDVEDIAKATNYVRDALIALKAGKAVAVTSTTPYGCSVKYP